MAHIFLVNPQIANAAWGAGHHPRTMEEALPRHSLTHLSAVLKETGHKVSLLDLRLLAGWEQYGQTLKTVRPDVVCVTAHTLEVEIALECLVRAKREVRDCTTIAGGIHFTMFPEAALNSGAVDLVLRGEGEWTLPRVIASPGDFDPVIWGQPPDLNRLPFEDRSLYPDYCKRILFPLWELPLPTVDLLTGRGCPWSCRFCCGPGEKNLYTKASSHNPTKRIPYIRRRSVDHVMAELKELDRCYGFCSVIFHDDQFLMKPDWVMRFCERLHREGYVRRGLRWWAASRSDMICRHPEAVKAMKEAGLKVLSVGFESFNDDVLAWLRKGVDRDTNLKAAEICHQLGVEIYANVIFGIPREDGQWYIEDDLVSAKAIEKMRPRYFSPSFFNAVPGSWFFEWAKENDLFQNESPAKRGSRCLDQCWIKGVDYHKLGELIHRLQHKLNRPWHSRLRSFFRNRNLTAL
jgi:radical SAM superfamily enzyme YgiQ (UPF0313 family)